jgi:N-acetylglucosaminyldiphosphoundecaprenol N-acetyl-beta-D-mannosaminyltransferase
MEAASRGDRRNAPRGTDRRRFPRRRIPLMGLALDQLTEEQTVESVIGAVNGGRGGCLFTPNLHHLREYAAGTTEGLYKGARLVVADGMPLIWASKVQGTPLPERVAGSNLIWSLTRAAARHDASVFLLGGSPGAADACATRLHAALPRLRIAGILVPPVGFEDEPGEVEHIVAELESTRPDIVYLGLGFPKQEWLAIELAKRFPSTWFVGVGISLSFVAGEVRRAPLWMQRTGLEWLWRLTQEPGRLFRRYVVEGIPFAGSLFRHAITARRRSA